LDGRQALSRFHQDPSILNSVPAFFAGSDVAGYAAALLRREFTLEVEINLIKG